MDINGYMEVSIDGGIPKMVQNPLQMDDVGYPYFRKPKYGHGDFMDFYGLYMFIDMLIL